MLVAVFNNVPTVDDLPWLYLSILNHFHCTRGHTLGAFAELLRVHFGSCKHFESIKNKQCKQCKHDSTVHQIWHLPSNLAELMKHTFQLYLQSRYRWWSSSNTVCLLQCVMLCLWLTFFQGAHLEEVLLLESAPRGFQACESLWDCRRVQSV